MATDKILTINVSLRRMCLLLVNILLVQIMSSIVLTVFFAKTFYNGDVLNNLYIHVLRPKLKCNRIVCISRNTRKSMTILRYKY